MFKRICTGLLCVFLFAGLLTGCGNNASETDRPTGNQDDGYTQTENDFDISEDSDVLDDSEPIGSGDTSPSGLEEVVIEGWNSSKKIKRILINRIHENILTTDDELYYESNGQWLRNDKVAGLGENLQFLSSLFVFNGEGLYDFADPDPGYPALYQYETNLSFKISKLGKSLGDGLLFVLDTDSTFRIICKNSENIYNELNLPPMLQDVKVIDFIKNNYYLKADGELREFPTFDTVRSDGEIVEFSDYSLFKLLISADVKQVFDAKTSENDVFILHNNNSLSYYDDMETELLEVNGDVGTIKEVVGDDFGFIVVTDNGYYSGRRNGELAPCEALNNMKDRIVSIAWFDLELVVILDDGKMYRIE